MKQFARCTSCRQWYTYSFTTTVEIFNGRQLPKATVWCSRCVADAERRSQKPTAPEADSWPLSSEPYASSPAAAPYPELPRTDDFQQLLLEHTALMEQAIHEDDAVLSRRVEDFMQRCRLYLSDLEQPEQHQRLTGHVQYWEAFLRALYRSQEP